MIGALFSACAYQPTKAPANATDYVYMSPSINQINSTAFRARRSLDDVIYSQCRWLPSDSEFYENTARRCGVVRGAYLAMGRALEEPDIADSERPHFSYQGRLRWVELPPECDP